MGFGNVDVRRRGRTVVFGTGSVESKRSFLGAGKIIACWFLIKHSVVLCIPLSCEKEGEWLQAAFLRGPQRLQQRTPDHLLREHVAVAGYYSCQQN